LDIPQKDKCKTAILIFRVVNATSQELSSIDNQSDLETQQIIFGRKAAADLT
jgi:hypothetical protein